MHNESDIIGHMTDCMVIDKEGKELTEQADEFDIVVESVIYKHWASEELQERMDRILEEIAEGKWYVSMECLFKNFDYGIVAPDGKQMVIARNEQSSFLTKHLRRYGGEGVYDGHKIGRVLRGFIFSGKGLVDKPANPGSIIFDTFKGAVASNIWENPMNEEIKAELEQIKAKLAVAESDLAKEKAKSESLAAEVIEAKSNAQKSETDKAIADLNEKIESLNLLVEEQKTVLASKDEDLNSTKASREDLEKQLRDALATIEAMKQEGINQARKASLVEAGVDSESADKVVAKFAKSDDEIFGEVLAAYKSKNSNKPKEPESNSSASITDSDVTQVSHASVSNDETEDENKKFEQTRASVVEFLKNSLNKGN